MRTTISLDPDVERLIKDDMHARDLSMKHVVNEAIRRGYSAATAPAPRPAYVPISFDMGPPLVDLTKAGALAAELEDQEIIAKLKAGR
jgi:hypothetical protein